MLLAAHEVRRFSHVAIVYEATSLHQEASKQNCKGFSLRTLPDSQFNPSQRWTPTEKHFANRSASGSCKPISSELLPSRLPTGKTRRTKTISHNVPVFGKCAAFANWLQNLPKAAWPDRYWDEASFCYQMLVADRTTDLYRWSELTWPQC